MEVSDFNSGKETKKNTNTNNNSENDIKKE